MSQATAAELAEKRRQMLAEHVPRIYPRATWTAKVSSEKDSLAATNLWITDLPELESPKLLIVIPFKDQIETTIKCLESIERQVHRLDVVVALVNNRSIEPGTLPRLRDWTNKQRMSRYEILYHDGAFNFARLNNAAIARLGRERDLILFLNNDVELLTPRPCKPWPCSSWPIRASVLWGSNSFTLAARRFSMAASGSSRIRMAQATTCFPLLDMLPSSLMLSA